MGKSCLAGFVKVFGPDSSTTKSKEETKLVRKLDFFILTYACFSYFFNFLDRSAFANAYVAGLRESLDLTGSDYNVLLSMATIGLLVGQIPNSIIIQKVPPRIWFPSMVLLWAGLTMASAGCKTYRQLCAVRFLMGFAEASTYAGNIYVMGSWYKPGEIAKRTAMFTVSGQVGVMFAGAMMAAIYTTMDGHAGLAGWQWVFLIDGIITCPIALFGYLYFPDLPETTRAPYLSESERRLALSRLPPKSADGHNIQAWSLARRLFGQPTIYVCCALSLLAAALQAVPTQNLFLLYLKSQQEAERYTQAQVNSLPLGAQALGVVGELGAALAIDALGLRVATGLAVCGLQAAVAALLLAPGVAPAGRFAAFYLAATAYSINPLLYGWTNIIAARGGDDAARGVILAAMAASGFVLWSFWGIVFYPAGAAPDWRNGCIVLICVAAVLAGWMFVVRWLDEWTANKYHESLEPAGDRVYDVQGAADEEKHGAKPTLGNEVQPTHAGSD